MKTGKVFLLLLKSIPLVLTLKIKLAIPRLREKLRERKLEKRKKRLLKKERKRAKMINQTGKDGIPGMPDSPDELLENSGNLRSDSPGSGSTEITEELAGDLLNLPFQVWGSINPVVLPLSPLRMKLMAAPFSRILEKYGLGKIAKDEIILGFFLSVEVYARVKAVHDSKKDLKFVRNNSGKAGAGENDVSKNSDQVAGAGSDIHP